MEGVVQTNHYTAPPSYIYPSIGSGHIECVEVSSQRLGCRSPDFMRNSSERTEQEQSTRSARIGCHVTLSTSIQHQNNFNFRSTNPFWTTPSHPYHHLLFCSFFCCPSLPRWTSSLLWFFRSRFLSLAKSMCTRQPPQAENVPQKVGSLGPIQDHFRCPDSLWGA